MKRFRLISLWVVVVSLGTGPMAFGGDKLKPVADAPPEYANASGTATMHWEQGDCSYLDWDTGKIVYYKCWDGWSMSSCQGLVPRTDYNLVGYTTDGRELSLNLFGTDDTGSAVSNGSIYFGYPSKFSIDYYEVWTVSIDPDHPWIWDRVELVLSSQRR